MSNWNLLDSQQTCFRRTETLYLKYAYSIFCPFISLVLIFNLLVTVSLTTALGQTRSRQPVPSSRIRQQRSKRRGD